jgi:hypothetical protein
MLVTLPGLQRSEQQSPTQSGVSPQMLCTDTTCTSGNRHTHNPNAAVPAAPGPVQITCTPDTPTFSQALNDRPPNSSKGTYPPAPPVNSLHNPDTQQHCSDNAFCKLYVLHGSSMACDNELPPPSHQSTQLRAAPSSNPSNSPR